MKAIIFLLLLGALCYTTSLADEDSSKRKKDELAFSQDGDDDAIERALLQLFAKAQDEEGDDEGNIQDDDDNDNDLLALLQGEDDEGEGESVKEQDDDDEGAAQHLRRFRFPFPRPCRRGGLRRCFPPFLFWLKKIAKKLIKMGSLTTKMGGKMSAMSSLLIRDGKKMSGMGGDMTTLGKSMCILGKKLLFLHFPFRG